MFKSEQSCPAVWKKPSWHKKPAYFVKDNYFSVEEYVECIYQRWLLNEKKPR